MTSRLIATMAVGALLLSALGSHARPITSLSQLLAVLPEPPATAEQMAQWLDDQNRLGHLGFAAARRALEAHKSEISRLSSSHAAAQIPAGNVQQVVFKSMEMSWTPFRFTAGSRFGPSGPRH